MLFKWKKWRKRRKKERKYLEWSWHCLFSAIWFVIDLIWPATNDQYNTNFKHMALWYFATQKPLWPKKKEWPRIMNFLQNVLVLFFVCVSHFCIELAFVSIQSAKMGIKLTEEKSKVVRCADEKKKTTSWLPMTKPNKKMNEQRNKKNWSSHFAWIFLSNHLKLFILPTEHGEAHLPTTMEIQFE